MLRHRIRAALSIHALYAHLHATQIELGEREPVLHGQQHTACVHHHNGTGGRCADGCDVASADNGTVIADNNRTERTEDRARHGIGLIQRIGWRQASISSAVHTPKKSERAGKYGRAISQTKSSTDRSVVVGTEHTIRYGSVRQRDRRIPHGRIISEWYSASTVDKERRAVDGQHAVDPFIRYVPRRCVRPLPSISIQHKESTAVTVLDAPR